MASSLLAKFTLPSPPSINRKYVSRRFVLSNKYREFKQAIPLIIKKNLLEGDLEMHLAWYRPRRSGDVDGRIKVVMDTLEGVCYENDRSICKLVVERFEDKANPRMEVEIYQYEGG